MRPQKRVLGATVGVVLVTTGIVVAAQVLTSTAGGAGAGSSATADSGRIVFYAVDDAGVGSYLVADPTARRTARLTTPGVDLGRGAIDPDGESTVVPCGPATLETSGDPAVNVGVCRVRVDTGERALVVDTGYPVQHPTPSPDGEQIVFASGAEADHGLKVTPSTGGEVRSLCDGFCPLYRFFDIAWSPDGTRVAFVGSTPGSGGHLPQIYVVTVGESDYTQLTFTGGMESDVEWSPDGTKLAFSSSRTGDTELWVMNADGSDQVQLTHRDDMDIDPSWSPDGTRIVYSRRIGDSWDLALISSTGEEPTALATMPGREVQPRWLPSGSG